MSVTGAAAAVAEALGAWEGIEAHPHRFGGTEYRLGRREIGHMHGDHLVDIPFPRRIRDEIVSSGRALPHHILPDTGWVSLYLHQPEDIAQAIALLRQSYELAVKQRNLRTAALTDGDFEANAEV